MRFRPFLRRAFQSPCPQCSALTVSPDCFRVFFDPDQLQTKVANPIEDAVKVGLIADLADQDGLFVAWFQGQALESRPEVVRQAAPDRDPVLGRLHICSGTRWVDPHFGPEPGE